MIKIEKILCPVDFSPASEKAVRYALRLASNYGARIRLLHVVSPVMPTAYEFPLNANSVIQGMEEDARVEMTKLLAKIDMSGVEVDTEARTGDIFTQIKKAIAAYKPDLLALGTHGRRRFERWFLGSTTERLLRHSPVPLLTIAAEKDSNVPQELFRRILVTTDFSAGTADALNYAFSIAEENNARITLLHVVNEHSTEISLKYRDSIVEAAERELPKLIPANAADWCDVDTRVLVGTPYQVILDLLAKEKVDLLVMNIHGKGMLERALLGSTAERVVRAATCPVMLIPPIGKAAKKAA